VLATHSRSPAEIAAYNPNFVGGDILTGANTPLQSLIRPRVAINPYATRVPGGYNFTAATPTGPGAHGLGGYNAALAAIRTGVLQV
jgi:phytoene dehydrogenase-like protein